MTSIKIAMVLLCAAVSAGAQTTPPDLTVAAGNGPSNPNYSGWPLLVDATVAITADDTKFEIPPAQITVAVFDSKGAKLDLPFAGLAIPTSRVVLDNNNDIATLRFALSPEQTANLAGDYTFEVTVGDLKSRTTVTLTAPPDPLTPLIETDRRFAFADYYLLTGSPQAALDLVNQELAVAPQFVPAMTRAASALEQLGRRRDAIQMLASAIEATQKQDPDATDPPRELIRRYQRLLLGSIRGNAQ
jgi:tetratricopeptide (TPR) repeat protein